MAKHESDSYSNTEYEIMVGNFEKQIGKPLSLRGREAARIALEMKGYGINNLATPEEEQLFRMLTTPPISWEATEKSDEGFARIKAPTIAEVQSQIALTYAEQLVRATALPLPYTLPLTQVSPDTFKALKQLYSVSARDAEFNTIITEATRGAQARFLEALSKPDVPLLPYSRKTAARLTGNQEDKVTSLMLDSRIPGVRVQYTYLENHVSPSIALRIEHPRSYWQRRR